MIESFSEFKDDKFIDRVTLMAILEEVLLDTMYDLPSSTSAKKVVVDEAVVTGENKPYVIHESDESPTETVEQQARPTGSDGA